MDISKPNYVNIVQIGQIIGISKLRYLCNITFDVSLVVIWGGGVRQQQSQVLVNILVGVIVFCQISWELN